MHMGTSRLIVCNSNNPMDFTKPNKRCILKSLHIDSLKLNYFATCSLMAMIYGEILKMGEKWLPILAFNGLFNADSKLPKQYTKIMWIPQAPHIENMTFNPLSQMRTAGHLNEHVNWDQSFKPH